MSSKETNKKIVSAKLRYVRISPRKVRQVTNLIKNLPVIEAEAQLMNSSRRPSVNVLKLLRSAIANAVNNENLNKENLYVKSIKVDEGPVLKRGMPRARGMMDLIKKKMSHVTIELVEKETSKRSKFVIPDKPEKDKDKPEDKKDKEKQDDPFENRDIPEPEKKELKAKKPGMVRKFFRRKSV